MGLLHLLIAALAANAAMAADDCKCVNPDQTIDPISAPMIFFQQPTIGGVSNGVPCAANCTFNAHAYGDKGLAITILANDLNNAKITVTDGPRTFLITKNTVQKDIDWKSTGDLLTFNFEGEVSPVATFMLVVQSTETRDPLPVIISTTAAAPTPPYDNLKYHNNPLLVADDIMIGIDLSSNDVENLKAFASDLISTLTITNATDCGAGTRLALHGLTNFDGFSPTYFPDWQYTLENALGNIKAMSQIGSGAFNIGPVSTFVESGFKKAGDEKLSASDCLNRGRIYLLLTTSQYKIPNGSMKAKYTNISSSFWPAEYQPAKPAYGPIVNFIDRGVHPIIVTSLKEDKRPYYDQYGTKPTDTKGSNRWSYFNIDSGVTNFINNYLVDTIPDMSCQLSKDYKITLTKESINQREAISIPPYYDGMNSDQQNTDSMEEEAWGTIKHYCNFQSTTISIEQAKETNDLTYRADVCVKVFYDLETDKDYISVYSGDLVAGDQKEVVRLTGRDVSGTTFRLGKKVGSIVFSSDEKNVYDGFYAEVYPCGKVETPDP